MPPKRFDHQNFNHLDKYFKYVKSMVTEAARLRRALAAERRRKASNVALLVQHRLSLGTQLAGIYRALQGIVAELEGICLEKRTSRSHDAKKVCAEHALALQLLQDLLAEL
jgi:broad specificity phosphatase PhoE